MSHGCALSNRPSGLLLHTKESLGASFRTTRTRFSGSSTSAPPFGLFAGDFDLHAGAVCVSRAACVLITHAGCVLKLEMLQPLGDERALIASHGASSRSHFSVRDATAHGVVMGCLRD